MTSEDQRIREFAYQIWQSEGCPHGQDERHWDMARKLVEAEKTPLAASVKPAANRARKPAAKAIETAAATPSAAKPRATRAGAKASQAAPKAGTEAAAGAPEKVKKPRASRAKPQA
ncbi:DUF2934 domain-containing protein [Pseudomonas oligotrophica]|uniref:DUF2934 domain-containing protein n=1 Tax=Pseudomonas oligotrophica TaxID=2912055 RepID=UPI001F3FBD44|nr:DUF2934 domain-containing protein [Pseudomonas oligotrophica]MCF7202490.1 DUF2934 domain-containing protein [Pseudomonas oligotrophica]